MYGIYIYICDFRGVHTVTIHVSFHTSVSIPTHPAGNPVHCILRRGTTNFHRPWLLGKHCLFIQVFFITTSAYFLWSKVLGWDSRTTRITCSLCDGKKSKRVKNQKCWKHQHINVKFPIISSNIPSIESFDSQNIVISIESRPPQRHWRESTGAMAPARAT